MRFALFFTALISFNTFAGICTFTENGEAGLKSETISTSPRFIKVQSQDGSRLWGWQDYLVARNVIQSSMTQTTYLIQEANIDYTIVHTTRSCGKGCEIGTFLTEVVVDGISYRPSRFEPSCLLN